MRKGHAVTELPDPGPDWLVLLRATRYGNGWQGVPEISNRANLPTRRVADILKGRVIPLRKDLIKLVHAMDPEGEDLGAILHSYDVMYGPHNIFPSLDFDPRSDMVRLADAISDLAQAITEFTAAAHPKPDQH